jgi:chaperone required for assembly of F1-ATPase
MSEWKARRFWSDAAPEPVEGGFEVRLDGRPVRTPAKTLLVVPTERLAHAVSAEWQAQGETVDPTTMPMTRMANSALDKVTPQQADVAEHLAAYGESDLLCYRADAPQELVDRQAAAWDPLLAWAEDRYGARLAVGTGVMFVPQEADAVAALRRPVDALDPWALAAFHDLVALPGSLVIAFAATSGEWDRADLWARSRIDEAWQAEQWGVDEEAAALASAKGDAFLDAGRFYDLVQK